MCFSPKDDQNLEGNDHKQNTKKCVGSNGEISFNVKSNVNGGQLEVRLTRKGLGWIATDRFEVRQKG